MNLGIENKKQVMVAATLGVVALLLFAYWFLPSSSTIASTSQATSLTDPHGPATHSGAHHVSGSGSGKKERPAPSLDPTLHLQLLASTEQIKYDGSGRNIFVSQADAVIPIPQSNGTTDKSKAEAVMQIQPQAPPPPIPLKFFGFANRPGELKKVFLSKGDDVFIAGEGEIIDRRYKVVRISATAVEIQDLVGSGPPQSIQLTLGNPS